MKLHSDELREMALAGGCLNRRTIGQLWNEFDQRPIALVAGLDVGRDRGREVGDGSD